MNSKEKCIAEAYGEYWEQCKNYVDSNGWIKVGTYHNNEPIDFEMFEIDLDSVLENVPFGYFSEVRETVRPKSLTGLENNRGWIEIKSEYDLPKDISLFYKYCIDGVPHNINCNLMTLKANYCYYEDKLTHYKVAEQEPPPLH